MKMPSLLIYGTVAVLVFLIVANLAIAIYSPTAVKSAVKATQNTTYTVDGVDYVTTGNGDSPQAAAQSARDNINTAYLIVNALGGVAFILVLIFGILGLISKKQD